MKKRTFKSHSKVNKQKCCCSIYLPSTQVSSTQKMNYFAGSKFFIARLLASYRNIVCGYFAHFSLISNFCAITFFKRHCNGQDKARYKGIRVTCMVKLTSLFRKMLEYIPLSKGSYSAFKKI